MEDLAISRKKINELDQQLVKLLEERFSVVIEINNYKTKHDLPVFDAKREQQVLAKVAELADDSAILPYLQKIYQEIMYCSREYQKNQRKD